MVKISKLGVRTVSALKSASPLKSPSGLARRLVLAGLLAPVLLATGPRAAGHGLPATGALASTARTADPASAPDFRHACSTATSPGHEVCQALVQTGGVTHAGLVRDSVPAGYGPADLQSAYSLTQAAAAAGRGQTVAIVDAFDDPNAASDLALYRSQYHLPPCAVASGCFRKVNQDGNASPLPRAAGQTGWDEEESLDLDMVSAIVPELPHHPGRGEQRRDQRPRHRGQRGGLARREVRVQQLQRPRAGQ